MEKTKNQKVVTRLTVLLIVLALVVVGFASYTLARYIRSGSATDEARVAKFQFASTITVGSTTEDMETTPVTINIFDTTDDTGVKTGVDENLIAPGTTGSFRILATGTSEVAVEVIFTLAETNDDGIPVYYTYGGVNYSSAPAAKFAASLDVQPLSGLATALKTTYAPGATVDLDKTITWTWAFEAGADADENGTINGTDTDLGEDGTATIELVITCTARQLDVAA